MPRPTQQANKKDTNVIITLAHDYQHIHSTFLAESNRNTSAEHRQYVHQTILNLQEFHHHINIVQESKRSDFCFKTLGFPIQCLSFNGFFQVLKCVPNQLPFMSVDLLLNRQLLNDKLNVLKEVTYDKENLLGKKEPT